ncbi:DUF4145 domain-containing protein [Acrocarpospora catenulata]|uniref:DUF4145 domain-containing protein n=1 Tax=Acrocarpospora catenulata TaxID=2836182 RepID=UPI001BD9419E|nr:DUF4145 domain-containing protein [Acrocarpospora catenulata]
MVGNVWVDMSDDPFLLVNCPLCKRPVSGSKERSIFWKDEDAEPYQATLLLCRRCKAPFLALQVPDGEDWGDPEVIWPDDSKEPISEAIPQGVRREFREALDCFELKKYQSAAVAVGRTLEAVCSHHNASEQLYVALNKLREQSIIDNRLLDWAHALRIFRNAGAHHGGKPIRRTDIEDALALTKAFLDHIYVIPAQRNEIDTQYQEFRRRRAEQA